MKRAVFILFCVCLVAIGAGYTASRFIVTDRIVPVADRTPAPAQMAPMPAPTALLPRTIIGRIVSITDGDTVRVLDNGRERKIRLAGIDAPEHNQDFGQKSKQYLASLIFNMTVTIQVTKLDKYGRLIGQISDGSKDVNKAMIEAGLAWHYKKYENEQPVADRESYAEAEASARQAKLGLWSIPNPQAPWDFRHPEANGSK